MVFVGWAKVVTAKPLGQMRPTPPLGYPSAVVLAIRKKALQAKRLQVSPGLVSSGFGVQLVFLDSKDGKFSKLLIVESSNPGSPAGDVGGNQKKMFAHLPFTTKALGGIPNPQIAHNVDDLSCRTRSCILFTLRLFV